MKDSVELFLEAVVDRVKVALNPAPGANVQLMLDNYDNFKPTAVNADVLIHYLDSEPIGGSVIREEVNLDVYLFARKYSSDPSVFRYVALIKKALANWRCDGTSTPVKYLGNRFYNHKQGIWCYIISFSTTMLIKDEAS